MGITIAKLSLSNTKLASIPDAERSLFLMLGHISNELSCLRRLLIVSTNHEAPNPMRARAHVSQVLLLARLLGGKCKEAWAFIEKQTLESDVGAAYSDHMTDEARKALEALKRRFGDEGLFHALGDVLAFQYLTENWPAWFEKSFAELFDSNVEFFTGGSRANTHWYMSEIPINHAMIQAVDAQSFDSAMDSLLGEISNVADLLGEFTDEMMWTIGRRYLGEDHGIEDREEVTLRDAPSMREIVIPVFFSDTGESGEDSASAD